jgi:hypothetical protein
MRNCPFLPLSSIIDLRNKCLCERGFAALSVTEEHDSRKTGKGFLQAGLQNPMYIGGLHIAIPTFNLHIVKNRLLKPSIILVENDEPGLLQLERFGAKEPERQGPPAVLLLPSATPDRTMR